MRNGDGVPDNDDLCPGTASGEAVDDVGCSTDSMSDSVPSACGACGAFGMISWTMLLVGFVGLRAMSATRRERPINHRRRHAS